MKSENKIRVVIDTNILVSGLLFGGLPGQIIDLVLVRQLVCCCSPLLKSEMDRVLMKPKFKLTENEYTSLTEPFYDEVEWYTPNFSISVIERCPADNRVLECAIESQSEFIITGDRRDLVSLGTHEGIKILQPKAFLEIFLASKFT